MLLFLAFICLVFKKSFFSLYNKQLLPKSVVERGEKIRQETLGCVIQFHHKILCVVVTHSVTRTGQ